MSVGEKMIVLGGRDVDGLDIIGFEVTGFYYPLNKCQILFCDTYGIILQFILTDVRRQIRYMGAKTRMGNGSRKVQVRSHNLCLKLNN